MAKVNRNKLIRDLNEVQVGQQVQVLNYYREGDRTRVERGGKVTVREVVNVDGRVTVLDALGVVASNMDASTRLERV